MINNYFLHETNLYFFDHYRISYEKYTILTLFFNNL